MKTIAVLSASVALAGLAVPAVAAPQPPMGTFDDAYYTCDNHGALQMSYDSATPNQVNMTTSNNNTQYTLKRAPVASGVQFASGGVEFWTDGKTAIVKGTKVSFQNCHLKSTS